MNKKLRKRRILGIRNCSKKQKSVIQTSTAIGMLSAIQIAQWEVNECKGYVKEDTQKERRCFNKFLLALFFYILLFISAIFSRTNTDTKVIILIGLSCFMFFPTGNWLASRFARKHWEKLLDERLADLRRIKAMAQNTN